MCRSGSRQPRRPAAGTVTTTPRTGWMTTRRPRERGDRRSVYGSGPPGSLATAGVSLTAPPSMDAAASRRSVTSVEATGRAARPVSAPSRIAARPLTMTCWMPVG